MKGVRLCKKNTDLYELNSNKDVVRMCGRGNLSLLTRELIKKGLLRKKVFLCHSITSYLSVFLTDTIALVEDYILLQIWMFILVLWNGEYRMVH